MWRGLTSISTLTRLLTDLTILIREQNSLLRELLQAQGRPAKTLPTPLSAPPPPAPKANRIRTDKDVMVVTREMLWNQQVEAERAKLPHTPPAGTPPPIPEPFFEMGIPVAISPIPGLSAPQPSGPNQTASGIESSAIGPTRQA